MKIELEKMFCGSDSAGGTLTLYTDNTMSVLDTIYSDSGLTLPVANPISIDLQGWTDQPVYRQTDNSSYIVISDANGAILRAGFAVPISV